MDFLTSVYAYVLKAWVVINSTSVSSLGSISYEKDLLTDLDKAKMYRDGHVTLISAIEMMRAYSDVNTHSGPRLTPL